MRDAYIDALSDPISVHAICEEYRAAATLDREHDESDRRAKRRIQSPLLAFWSATGALGRWYEELGGPLALWREWANDVEGFAVQAGHFFPEEIPDETAAVLTRFFIAG